MNNKTLYAHPDTMDELFGAIQDDTYVMSPLLYIILESNLIPIGEVYEITTPTMNIVTPPPRFVLKEEENAYRPYWMPDLRPMLPEHRMITIPHMVDYPWERMKRKNTMSLKSFRRYLKRR